jgi:diguanylate cyclase (GGDEF)-like protein/PAS domain S-box-containing protein
MMKSVKQPASQLANGQTLRLPGGSRDVALHDQLYRYAEDLEQSIDRCMKLEAQNKNLRDSCTWLEDSRRQLDDVIRTSRDIHIITDLVGTILQSNPAAMAIAPLQRLAGENLSAWVLPPYRENFYNQCINVIDETSQDNNEWEMHLRHATNDTFPLIVSARVLPLYKNNQANGLHWVLRDITYLRETEFDTQIATTVFKSSAEGVMITDAKGEILAVNPAFTQITGYSADEAIGHNVSLLKSGVQDEAFYTDFWHSLRENRGWQGELYNRKKSGEMYPEWLTISAASDSDGCVLSYVAIFSDISRLLRAEKRRAYLAHYDTLTGLPNRHLFQDRLTQILASAKRSSTPFTLIFIDLDKFKEVNNTLGHHAGDRVLQEAGKRLLGAVREIDTVARLGGDEFVIIAPTLSGADNIGRVCRKAIQVLAQPIHIDGRELLISSSFGCAEYPIHGDNDETLLRNADNAMYRAKAAGGNGYFIYEAGSQSPAESG